MRRSSFETMYKDAGGVLLFVSVSVCEGAKGEGLKHEINLRAKPAFRLCVPYPI